MQYNERCEVSGFKAENVDVLTNAAAQLAVVGRCGCVCGGGGWKGALSRCMRGSFIDDRLRLPGSPIGWHCLARRAFKFRISDFPLFHSSLPTNNASMPNSLLFFQ
jgi:hypothetical protein